MVIGDEDDTHEQRQQENVRDVQHPRTAQDPHTGDQISVTRRDASIGQNGSIPRQKHENFSSIAKAEVAQGQLRERIFRYVIPKDEDQRQTSKEIDSMVASVRHDGELFESLYREEGHI